jgi:hypothetical protein
LNQRTFEPLSHNLKLLLTIPNLHQQVFLLRLSLRELPAQRILKLRYAPTVVVLLLRSELCLKLLPYLKFHGDFCIVQLRRDTARAKSERQ